MVRSPLGLPLGGPGLLPGPPALPGCWPEAYIIQYCGSFSNVRTLLDTYTSGSWGGWRPPLVPNKFVSGGPPLDSLSSRDRSEVALNGRGRDGGPPLISELYRCINVFPPCMGGRPGTGGPRLISKLHRHIKVVPPCMGGGPGTGGPPLISFPLWHLKIPLPLVGRGPGIGGPPLISLQPFRYGFWGVSSYFKPQLQVSVPRPDGQMTRDGGPPLLSQHFLGSQTSRLQAGAITPAQ